MLLSYTPSGMKAREIERFRLKMEAVVADVGIFMGCKERRQHTEEYIRGILRDRDRKSIESVTNRIPHSSKGVYLSKKE